MSCDCDWEGDESPEVSRVETRIAHAEHKCEECGRTIKLLEPYKRHFQIWEGEPQDFCICADCERVSVAHRAGMKADKTSGRAPSGHIIGELRCAVACMVKESPEYLAAFRSRWREMRSA
jgi:hypothetical protein